MFYADQAEVLRSQLQNHFTLRKQRNSSYSLRGYARDLRVDPSLLSKVIKGTANISPRMYDKIRAGLELKHEELEVKEYKSGEASFRVLEADMFSVISDWYHYALIELIRTKDFESNPQWIAKRLGITPTEVNIAIERLIRLRMIKRSLTGKITDQAGNNTTGTPQNGPAAFRKLQKQLLEKAIDHIDRTTIDKRDNSSLTVAINTADLPKLIKSIDKFRREFATTAENDPAADEVYNLSISLFPCTQRGNS